MNAANCNNCKWFNIKPYIDGSFPDRGSCHRRSPIGNELIHKLQEVNGEKIVFEEPNAVWPKVLRIDTCGDYSGVAQ